VIEIKMHLKIRIFIFALALLLIAPDGYAFATSYDMFVYSDMHYSYVVQGIEVQKRILDAFSGGALLPVLIIFFVYCLFMWVRRISEKGDVLNFAVWFFAFFIMSFMTFSAKTDIRMNIYKWEEATKTQHVNYVTTIEDAPGINSFFAQATKFVTILTHAILGRTAGKETADVIASCNPERWYFEATKRVLAYIAEDRKRPDVAAKMLDEIRDIDRFAFKVPKIIAGGALQGLNIDKTIDKIDVGGAALRMQAWAKLSDEIRKNAEKCNVPDPKSDLGVMRKKATKVESTFNTSAFKNFQQMIRDVPQHLKPIQQQVGVIGETHQPLFIGFARDALSLLAKQMAQIQLGLNFQIYVMLMIQSITTAFFLLLFPLFLLFSFAAINDYTYGINWKVLIGFLVAFFLVQSWYPAIIFVKALVFRQFIM
jgi:uncharacterized membrane protein